MEEFFFRAMLKDSWAAGNKRKMNLVAPGVAIPDGFVGHYYQEGNGRASLILIDAWQSGTNNAFFGYTTIWQGGIDLPPVWVMQYYGFMEKQVEALVRKSLMMAYSQGHFLNGRGIDGLRGMEFTSYHNKNILDCSIAHDFSQFAGIESIVKVNPEDGGKTSTHSFLMIQGGLLSS